MLVPFAVVLSALYATPVLKTYGELLTSIALIGARGTGDPVGAAYAWRAMANSILSQAPGGTLVSTTYLASRVFDG
jgi:hypothetical protein